MSPETLSGSIWLLGGGVRSCLAKYCMFMIASFYFLQGRHVRTQSRSSSGRKLLIRLEHLIDFATRI
jgi:hypothetical protein